MILSIGPLARLDRRFLPLLYNRRHLGVTMFVLALAQKIAAKPSFALKLTKEAVNRSVDVMGQPAAIEQALMKALEKGRIGRETLTLHVGAGTFLPVKAEDTSGHKMHAEWGRIDAATADRLIEVYTGAMASAGSVVRA